ncbi:MAG: squalene/phytoene synthase family protein [Acidobacteriota bacterium]|nr:squalene/phytoene synthase family protein [Acidobacteriota bacterium]
MNSQPLEADPALTPGPPSAEPPDSYVRRVTRSSGTSFYYAFLTLPRPRREAIFAVYAFCKAVDSAVDEAPDIDSARRELDHWRGQLEAAFTGRAKDPIAIEVGRVSRAFTLPRALFEAVIAGVALDLEPLRFDTWERLGSYCDLVAGAVGQLCVRIFGCGDPWADDYAIKLGRALQLTNILRDLGPDARRGRFYLPLEDLRRFDVDEAAVIGTAANDQQRRGLLRFEAERARRYFDAARQAGRRGGRDFCAAEVMGAVYRRLLDRIVAADFPTSGPLVHVPRREKLALAAATWLRVRLARRQTSPD